MSCISAFLDMRCTDDLVLGEADWRTRRLRSGLTRWWGIPNRSSCTFTRRMIIGIERTDLIDEREERADECV